MWSNVFNSLYCSCHIEMCGMTLEYLNITLFLNSRESGCLES